MLIISVKNIRVLIVSLKDLLLESLIFLDWFYLIKLYFARNAVKRYKEKFRSQIAPLKEDFETGFNLPSGEVGPFYLPIY